jgi:hypothetical protein
MKRFIVSLFATVIFFAAATTMLWSHSSSINRPAASASMMSLQELNTTAGVNKLPTENFEDQSLVFSTVAKR